MTTTYRLRISNGLSHAEEFSASSPTQFSAALADALMRFEDWRIAQIPPYQTIKREQARKYMPTLQIHIWNDHLNQWSWLSNPANGNFCGVSENSPFRHYRALWDRVNSTNEHGEALADFFNGLGSFLRGSIQPTESTKPRLVIDNTQED